MSTSPSSGPAPQKKQHRIIVFIAGVTAVVLAIAALIGALEQLADAVVGLWNSIFPQGEQSTLVAPHNQSQIPDKPHSILDRALEAIGQEADKLREERKGDS